MAKQQSSLLCHVLYGVGHYSLWQMSHVHGDMPHASQTTLPLLHHWHELPQSESDQITRVIVGILASC